MAKRTRGASRPGQRRPVQRPAVRPPSPAERPTSDATPIARPSGALTAAEEARAAELEERIVAEERAAEDAQRRVRDRSRAAELAGPRTPREAAPLAVKAAAEYAYVRRDIIRIATVGGILLAVLVLLYVLINVMGVIRV